MVALRFLTTFVVASTMLLSGGCELWKSGGSVFTSSKHAYSLPVPAGWSYATTMGPDFVASKDGLTLQSIAVQVSPLEDALMHSERSLRVDMIPFEVAETIIDDLRADRELDSLAVLRNEPATIGGRVGFKLTLAYRNHDQLRMTETRYAVIHSGQLWTLRFRAPSRHYHGRDLGDFERMVAGFQFRAGTE